MHEYTVTVTVVGTWREPTSNMNSPENGPEQIATNHLQNRIKSDPDAPWDASWKSTDITVVGHGNGVVELAFEGTWQTTVLSETRDGVEQTATDRLTDVLGIENWGDYGFMETTVTPADTA